MKPDEIRDACAARAQELALTPYAIAKATDGAVSQDQVRAYLNGTSSMTSVRLQHVLRVLGLRLTPRTP